MQGLDEDFPAPKGLTSEAVEAEATRVDRNQLVLQNTTQKLGTMKGHHDAS